MSNDPVDRIRLISAVAAGWLLAAVPVHADAETTLTLSSWLPATQPIVTDIIEPWARDVERATHGEVKVEILPSALGKPPAHFDLARNGIADITYGAQGYSPGRFVTTKIAFLPFLGSYAEATSVALWRTHERYLAQANEYEAVKLLSIFTHGPGQVHNSRQQIQTVADLQGMKFRTTGGYAQEIAERLGMVPLLKPVTEAYALLSRGVADGILLPVESVTALNLQKLVPNTTLVPGGVYCATFFLVMNKERFDSLSPANQKAINAVSGEALARMAGRMFDKRDAQAVTALKAAGNDIKVATPELVQEIKAAIGPIEQEWISEVKPLGINGSAALEYFLQQSASIEAKIMERPKQ